MLLRVCSALALLRLAYAITRVPPCRLLCRTNASVNEVAVVFDEGYDCLSIDPLVSKFALDLGRHSDQNLDLVAYEKRTRLVREEALGRRADKFASFHHRLESRGVGISRCKFVHSPVHDVRRWVQAVVLVVDLVDPLLQRCTALM